MTGFHMEEVGWVLFTKEDLPKERGHGEGGSTVAISSNLPEDLIMETLQGIGN